MSEISVEVDIDIYEALDSCDNKLKKDVTKWLMEQYGDEFTLKDIFRYCAIEKEDLRDYLKELEK